VNQPPSMPKKRHSFRPLMFAPPQGPASADALPTLPPPARVPRAAELKRSANDSHVRLRAPLPGQNFPQGLGLDLELLESQDLLDELCEDQLTMSMNVAGLEESIARAPRDASASAALRTLESRVADLGALRDALANVQLAMIDPRLQRLATPSSPLSEYLRGLYAWTHAVVRALELLATSLRNRPDWALLRWRLDEAKNFHFDELHEPMRADLLALAIIANGGSFGANRPAVEELQYAIERLISTAVALEEHLDERFG
jgi:hypothetical protein